MRLFDSIAAELALIRRFPLGSWISPAFSEATAHSGTRGTSGKLLVCHVQDGPERNDLGYRNRASMWTGGEAALSKLMPKRASASWP
jgi:hypothetical protein